MPRPFVLLLPHDDPELRDAIAEAFAGEIEVHEPPPHYGIDQVKLILDLVTDGATIAGTVAAATAGLIKLRNWYKNRPQPKRLRFKTLGGGKDVVLIEATDEELRQLAEE